jgi:DNA-binding NtrC family response regulator
MATILIVDDDSGLRESLAETITDLGHRAVLAGTGREALSQMATPGQVDAVLLDLRMPGDTDGIAVLRRLRERPHAPPVAILTAYASADNTIEAMRLGAFDHLTKPIGREQVADLLTRMLPTGLSGSVQTLLAGELGGDELVGSSDAMRQVQKTIGLAADSDATVLILGETGTGKEVVARALHRHSRRRHKPFVAVNCAAIPADLLESELFGHVKGAFTGAISDRLGAFREANGGMLLLDEIGDMPLAMQAKILRIIQDRIVTPVGGRPEAVDVRIVASTHRDLPELVAQGRFRQDLYYRLNVVPIVLAPLRDRLADIVPLAEHFLRASPHDGQPKRLTAAAAARLLAHPWPGNARELRNTIERASVLVRGGAIDGSDLDQLVQGARGRDAPDSGEDWLAGDLPTAVARLETAMIRRALDQAKGNRAEAARRLGVQRQLLYSKIERYGLDRTDEVSSKPTPRVGKPDG